MLVIVLLLLEALHFVLVLFRVCGELGWVQRIAVGLVLLDLLVVFV